MQLRIKSLVAFYFTTYHFPGLLPSIPEKASFLLLTKAQKETGSKPYPPSKVQNPL